MIALCASKAGVWVQSLVREEHDQVLLHAAQSIRPKLKKRKYQCLPYCWTQWPIPNHLCIWHNQEHWISKITLSFLKHSSLSVTFWMLWSSLPKNTYVEIQTPKVMVLEGEAFRRWWGQKDGTSTNEIRALVRDSRELLSPFLHVTSGLSAAQNPDTLAP